MDPGTAIRAAIQTSPKKEIIGKKRLQKTLRLMKYGRVPIHAGYEIRHFGPYSEDVAAAADFLAVIGAIIESERQIGPHGFFTTVYTLPESSEVGSVSPKLEAISQLLGRYTSLELEVASTIAHFLDSGHDLATAIRLTKHIKPSKVYSPVLQKARGLLEDIHKIKSTHGKRTKNSRSGS